MYRSNTIYTTILYTTIQVNGYLPIPTGRPGSTQPPEPAPRPPEQPRGAGPCPGPGGACPGSWWPWEPAAHPLGRYARGYRCHWPRRWPGGPCPSARGALGAGGVGMPWRWSWWRLFSFPTASLHTYQPLMRFLCASEVAATLSCKTSSSSTFGRAGCLLERRGAWGPSP